MTDWSIPAALRPAYQQCRAVAAEHGRSYYLATSLLPVARRPHVWALYAFARTCDDLVDHPGADPASALLARCEATRTALSGPAPAADEDPVLAALAHTLDVLGHDDALIETFLHSMVMDLTVASYPTWADLRGYMSGSAAAIGELMAPLLGATDPSAIPRARALGEAFQLTNFIRDIAEDRYRGRTYLPLEDLERFGVQVADLDECVATARITPAVRRLVAFEVERTEQLYALARPGLAQVDFASRPCLRAAYDLYRAILGEVTRARYDVFARRAVVPGWRRVAIALNATAAHQWATPRARPATPTSR